MAESRIAKRKKAAPSPLPRPKKKTFPLFLVWLGGVPCVFYFALELSLALCKRANASQKTRARTTASRYSDFLAICPARKKALQLFLLCRSMSICHI